MIKQKALDLTLEVTEGDTVHRIRFGDFNGLDARAFRVEMGMSLIDAFLRSDADVDVMAGLVWLHERKAHPNRGFADVAARFTYDDLFAGRLDQSVTSSNGDVEEDDGDPSP